MITLLRKNAAVGLLTAAMLPLRSQTVLDSYVAAGLQNNLVLQQKNIGLEKAMLALKTANSYFLPAVNLKADYQSGEGGRQIAIPLGDMLNPVYSTLNQMTMSNNFPQISNVKTYFFPQNFYDVKLRTSMPLINPDLVYNKRIQQDQAELQKTDIEIYSSELSKNIRVAYYNYLSALNAVAIYANAMELAAENKRLNESLLRNGKTVKAYVLRAESELQELRSRQENSLQQVQNARLYFNFLINSGADAAIDTSGAGALLPDESILSTMPDIKSRTELKAMDHALHISEQLHGMNKSVWVPKLSAFADLGSQASNFEFNDKSRYYFIGVQLDLPLFAGGRNYQKTRSSEMDMHQQQVNNNFMTMQLQMAAEMAHNKLKSSWQAYLASARQLESALSYHELISKSFREGMSTHIESIDARNQLTTARLQVNIAKFQLLSDIANYKRETGK